MINLKRFLVILFIPVLLISGGIANAQTKTTSRYPDKPIRMIVPFPAGQSSDILARLIADQLYKSMGQPVVVENRAGAGGVIGMDVAAKSAPDGYTLVTASSGPMAINLSLYPNLPYDPKKSFAAVINVASIPQVLVVSADSTIKSVQQLVAAAKDNPGKLSFGSAGNGTTQHLTMEMMRSRVGVDMIHVPYKGAAPATTDLMGGQIATLFDSIPSVLPFINSGKLRALAVSSAQRSPFLPDVPTIAESVSPGFSSMAWIGVAAPAGTPLAIVRRVNAEIEKALTTPEVKSRLTQLAFAPVGGSPENFTQFIEAEVAAWAKIVKDSGTKLE